MSSHFADTIYVEKFTFKGNCERAGTWDRKAQVTFQALIVADSVARFNKGDDDISAIKEHFNKMSDRKINLLCASTRDEPAPSKEDIKVAINNAINFIEKLKISQP